MNEFENVQTVTVGGTNQGNNIQASLMSRPGGITEYRVSRGGNQGMLSDQSFQGSNIQQNLGGVTTVQAGGSVASSPNTQTFNTSELNGGDQDLFSTARNNGLPARGNLTPDTVVNYQGIEVKLQNLEGLGIVKRTATGYEVVKPSSGTNADQQQDQGNKAPDGVEYFSQEVEDAIAEAIDPIPQGSYDGAIAKALEKGFESINFNEIAYHSGLTPGDVRQRAEMVLQAFTDQADQLATKQGIKNPSDVWEWAAEAHPKRFNDARISLAYGRNTEGLKALVKDYMDTVPPTEEALLRGGYEVRTDSTTGKQTFKYQGRWIGVEPFRVALSILQK